MNHNTPKRIGWSLPTLILIVVINVWAGSGWYLHNLDDRGSFGDMFGAVNALFSGLAFAGVILAILLQKEELSLQRKELELTRNELSGQKHEMELQNKTLLKQSFENTFFQLLNQHQTIINSIDVADMNNKNIATGRDCFKRFYSNFKVIHKTRQGSLSGSSEQETLNNVYRAFYNDYQADIGHYFRSLYHIVKLVDTSNIENKRLYTNLIRAQLSSYELTLLFYNGISHYGQEKFKPLIEEYAFFKHLPKNLLLNPTEHVKLYEPSAYA